MFFGVWFYDFLFFAIPLAVLVLFVICLCRYCSAVRQNRVAPDTFPPEELKKRKILLIVTALTAGVLLFVVLGFTALLFMALAFM